ncbi:hypothetical protein Tco_0513530 [Tanacetum coccineum]
MVTSMGIRHAKPYTLRGGPSTKLEQRPKIEDKDNFEPKGQFLKELQTNTFSSSDHEDANEHIEKVLEIVDLFHIPNITIDQVMLRAFPMSLIGAASWLENETNRGAIPSKTAADAKVAIQEMAEYSHKWQSMEDTLSKFMSESAKIHEENSNLIKEIRASTDVSIRTQRASIKTLEIQIGQMSKVLQERGFRSLPRSTEANPRDQVKSISTTIEVDLCPIRHMPEDIKVPFDLGDHSCLRRAKMMFTKRKITLRVREERIVFISVKPASSLIKRVYMLSLRERMEIDLEARLIGETLVNQGYDLMPIIEEGEVIEEFRTRDDELNVVIDDYPSYCDYDKKIHINCAYNLKFSCMIGFEFTYANFFPLLYVNVMSKKFHNSIMKEKLEYKGNNVVGTLMNVHVFVGTFSVMTDFAVLENMDACRDEGMGDKITNVVPTPRNPQYAVSKTLDTLYRTDSRKRVLNLGPYYIRDGETEEWLTRGHTRASMRWNCEVHAEGKGRT